MCVFVSESVCLRVCVRVYVSVCVRASTSLHLKVLLCLHMWACVFSVWWHPVRCRMNALWPFTVLQCGCSRVPECQTTALLSSSSLSCMCQALSLDRAQLDSGLCTFVLGYRNTFKTWLRSVMTCQLSFSFQAAGREVVTRNKCIFLAAKQTFQWITTSQW